MTYKQIIETLRDKLEEGISFYSGLTDCSGDTGTYYSGYACGLDDALKTLDELIEEQPNA